MMTSHAHRIDRPRVLRFVVAVGISTIAGWQGQPFLHGNLQAYLALCVALHLLTCIMLLTMLTLWTPPPIFSGKTWRSTAVLLKNMESRLTRRASLFLLCLLGTGLSVLCVLLNGLEGALWVWLERCCLGVACLSFLLAMGIPHSIRAARLEQVRWQIEREKERGNLPSRTG